MDEGEFATKPHHTHACQKCGHVWRPAIIPTVGVRFLPGFLDGRRDDDGHVWSVCNYCGGNIFRRDAWEHEGGTPWQNHVAEPAHIGEVQA